jgi:hypothetical protein
MQVKLQIYGADFWFYNIAYKAAGAHEVLDLYTQTAKQHQFLTDFSSTMITPSILLTGASGYV